MRAASSSVVCAVPPTVSDAGRRRRRPTTTRADYAARRCRFASRGVTVSPRGRTAARSPAPGCRPATRVRHFVRSDAAATATAAVSRYPRTLLFVYYYITYYCPLPPTDPHDRICGSCVSDLIKKNLFYTYHNVYVVEIRLSSPLFIDIIIIIIHRRDPDRVPKIAHNPETHRFQSPPPVIYVLNIDEKTRNNRIIVDVLNNIWTNNDI